MSVYDEVAKVHVQYPSPHHFLCCLVDHLGMLQFIQKRKHAHTVMNTQSKSISIYQISYTYEVRLVVKAPN
jgi:hypothetical protein